ncbi:hypothetical protein Gasu2_07180 [Galdieria sulphuraria]|nr:hypothetical protein Gasu2_07180 [Galdieria sulphuraria]
MISFGSYPILVWHLCDNHNIFRAPFVQRINKNKIGMQTTSAVTVATCETVTKAPTTIKKSKQVHTTESKATIYAARTESIPWNNGKKLSKEKEDKIVQSLRIRLADSEIRAARRERQLGKFRLPMDRWRLRVSKTSSLHGETGVKRSLPCSFCIIPMFNMKQWIFSQLLLYKSYCRNFHRPTSYRKLSTMYDVMTFPRKVMMTENISIEATKILLEEFIIIVKWKYGERGIPFVSTWKTQCNNAKDTMCRIHHQDVDKSTVSVFSNLLEQHQKNQRLANLLTRQMDYIKTGLSTGQKEHFALKRKAKGHKLMFVRNEIRMRKGTGGYEPLPKQANTEDRKEKQWKEKKSSTKKTSSNKESEPQYRRRIVSYNEDGSIIFERDLQPGEDSSVALEEWNEERSHANKNVVDAMNPELDWEQDDIQEKEQRQVTSSKRIPKWIVDDVDFDEEEIEEEENLFPSSKDEELEEEDVIE